METRSGAKSAEMSEVEVKHLAAKLKEKEERLRCESAAMNEQRAQFEREQRAYKERLEREYQTARAELERERSSTLPVGEILGELARLRGDLEALRKSSPLPEISRRTDAQQRDTEEVPIPRESSDVHTPSHCGISVREAAESVPEFTGYNIPLTQYVRACRRARELIPEHLERGLTKLLINRLKGRAYLAVEDEECESIADLTDLINEAFGIAKTIDQYRGELASIYKVPREHILDYITRVKDLRAAILDCERRRGRTITREVEIEVDMFTTRSFIEGLPLDYRMQLNNTLFATPFEAFSRAKQIAKRIDLDRERYSTTRDMRTDLRRERPEDPVKRDPPGNKTFQPSTANATSMGKTCSYCQKEGHVIENCFARKNQMIKSENRNGPSIPPGENRRPLGPPTRPIRMIGEEEEMAEEDEIVEELESLPPESD